MKSSRFMIGSLVSSWDGPSPQTLQDPLKAHHKEGNQSNQPEVTGYLKPGNQASISTMPPFEAPVTKLTFGPTQ
ncbi:hypothetical protein ATHL_01710 [Anaerolinea thermolimosa]|uniref:hypothetical protein n=1 Tax=Anaerolinea thermolimosa TaxID=229919 RepID=UPI0007844E66|nr:hypothetical protein [Anaerolinea thermolimosa]GAP06846.1 hypothetical protein ATHL_01710 [Anaerolinea thermolimosa]